MQTKKRIQDLEQSVVRREMCIAIDVISGCYLSTYLDPVQLVVAYSMAWLCT